MLTPKAGGQSQRHYIHWFFFSKNTRCYKQHIQDKTHQSLQPLVCCGMTQTLLTVAKEKANKFWEQTEPVVNSVLNLLPSLLRKMVLYLVRLHSLLCKMRIMSPWRTEEDGVTMKHPELWLGLEDSQQASVHLCIFFKVFKGKSAGRWLRSLWKQLW